MFEAPSSGYTVDCLALCNNNLSNQMLLLLSSFFKTGLPAGHSGGRGPNNASRCCDYTPVCVIIQGRDTSGQGLIIQGTHRPKNVSSKGRIVLRTYHTRYLSSMGPAWANRKNIRGRYMRKYRSETRFRTYTKLLLHPKQQPRMGGGLRQINTYRKITHM